MSDITPPAKGRSVYRDPRELRAEAARLRATANAIEDGTWAFICETPGTPGELAQIVGITPQAANNRLRKLYDLGLADREHLIVDGGGREFSYSMRLRNAS